MLCWMEKVVAIAFIVVNEKQSSSNSVNLLV